MEISVVFAPLSFEARISLENSFNILKAVYVQLLRQCYTQVAACSAGGQWPRILKVYFEACGGEFQVFGRDLSSHRCLRLSSRLYSCMAFMVYAGEGERIATLQALKWST